MNGNERRRWYQQQCCALKLELGRAAEEYATLLAKWQRQGDEKADLEAMLDAVLDECDADTDGVCDAEDVPPGGLPGVGGGGEPDPVEGDPGRAPGGV